MNVIYPGTFDPFSLGHSDIVARAVEMYDHVTVAISENPQKKPMFSFQDRVHMARVALKGFHRVQVVGFTGLLVDLMEKIGVRVVIRGIRGMVDFEYEFQMAQVNRSMLPGFEPVFLMPGEKYMVLSSSVIREVVRHNGDVSKFLPKEVNDYIVRLLQKQVH